MPRRTGEPKKDDAALAAVTPEIAALSPAEWPDRCGPIRAWRNPGATRHVWGRSPWGGYELAVERQPKPEADTSAGGEQLALL